MRGIWILLGLALLTGGCTPSEQRAARLEEAMAGVRQEASPDAVQATDLPMQGAEPHHLRMVGTFVLRQVGASSGRSISVTREVYRGKRQAFRIEELRFWTDPVVAPEGRQDGRQAVFDGKALAVRRSWGPWMDRETVGAPQHQLLREAHDIGPSVLEAFGPYMIFREDPEGETTMSGVRVRWERVGLDSAVAPRPLEPEALKALREHDEDWKIWMAASHKPLTVKGRIARRVDAPHELVAGSLQIEGIGTFDDQRRDFMVLLDYEIGPLPPHASLVLPEETLPARRARPWKMVKEALGDELLPPYRP
ncbi:MAG: hypothetical protein ACPGU1_02005 [Myxococcota bacterium]